MASGARKARFERADCVYDQVFAFAHEVVPAKPGVID
jgi:hypothetical protein